MPNIHGCVRILVLTMLLCHFPVLDGKFRTAVQAAKAQGAALFLPNRLLVHQLDSLYRTFFGAKSTSDALLLYFKELGLSHVVEVCIC